MSIRRVLRVLLLVGIFFGPIIAASLWNALNIREASEQYRPGRFVVTGSHCIGGLQSSGREGRSTSSPIHCFLEGRIGGMDEELKVDEPDLLRYPPGTEITVWYAPELPRFDINYQPLRMLWDEGKPPSAHAEAVLTDWYQLPLRFSLIVILLEVFYAITERPFWRDAESDTLCFADEGALVTIGYGLAGFGLTSLSFQITEGVHAGPVLFGLAATGIGLLLCTRRIYRIDRKKATLSTRRGFWPLFLPENTTELDKPPGISLQQTSPGGPVRIFVKTKQDTRCVLSTADLGRATQIAERLAALLRQPLSESWPEDQHGRILDAKTRHEHRGSSARPGRPGRALSVLLLAIIAGVSTAAVVNPEFSAPLWRRVLARDMDGLPTPLRTFAAERLAVSSSDETVLLLLWTTNTANPDRQAALGETALASLETIARRSFEAENRNQRLRAVNAWAAERLGRRLDAYGGVLTWFRPLPRWRDLVEQIAASDVHGAWAHWDLFAAGDLTNSYQFAGALASALTDPRPIHFAIRRGSFLSGPGPNAPAFEGGPEPIERLDEVLVHTVAGAIALKMWEMSDVSGDAFPEDFEAWWEKFARQRLFPPLPNPP